MAVLQTVLPYTPWADPVMRKMPGMQPVAPGEWLQVDEAYAGQLAQKARLLSERRGDVLMLDPGARGAAQELLARVLAELENKPGFAVEEKAVRRPDGESIARERAEPLKLLSRLVQEDFCILQKRGKEHVLTGALLCFPASWTLAEKFMQPLVAIHMPVGSYDTDMAQRVQRMFDMIRPEQPLWRANALFYDDPALYQPRQSGEERHNSMAQSPYIRSERQTILRLPETGALIFSIHTYVIRRENLTPEQADSLKQAVMTQR